ncbi:DUF1367 family protein [Pedobacter sp. HDW13]|uniref:DUF1367 family protein n=1 Tax=Pedobacter sp. HDW13 TaxID=2714940 RepID=UPI0014085295|nr:DUF1367 family protein [Pedobacter sp. HDW13]
MKLSLVKQLNNTFKVAFDSDYEKLQKIKPNEMVECEITKPRNYKFHKKFFALINLVFDNQEIYQHLDDLRHDLIVESGYFESRPNLYGEEIKKPKSISFAKMDEYEFNELYSAVLDTIIKHFNFDRQDIIDNVEQFF